MTIKTFIMTCGLAVCLLAQPAAAGAFEDGQAAYDKGDYGTALGNWLPLAEQGNAWTQLYLGFMYINGQGVPQDDAEALKWFRKAADQGNAYALGNLGVTYENGNGAMLDYVKSYMWWKLAAANSPPSETKIHDVAATNLARIAAMMTPEQIAEARRLAREWLAAHDKK